jgi:hypothetical protein
MVEVNCQGVAVSTENLSNQEKIFFLAPHQQDVQGARTEFCCGRQGNLLATLGHIGKTGAWVLRGWAPHRPDLCTQVPILESSKFGSDLQWPIWSLSDLALVGIRLPEQCASRWNLDREWEFVCR